MRGRGEHMEGKEYIYETIRLFQRKGSFKLEV